MYQLAIEQTAEVLASIWPGPLSVVWAVLILLGVAYGITRYVMLTRNVVSEAQATPNQEANLGDAPQESYTVHLVAQS